MANDVPPLLAELRRRHPGLQLRLLPVLSELPAGCSTSSPASSRAAATDPSRWWQRAGRVGRGPRRAARRELRRPRRGKDVGATRGRAARALPDRAGGWPAGCCGVVDGVGLGNRRVRVLLTAQPFIALGVLQPAEIGAHGAAAGTMRVVVLAVAALLLNGRRDDPAGRRAGPGGGHHGGGRARRGGARGIVFRACCWRCSNRALPQRGALPARTSAGRRRAHAGVRRAARTAAPACWPACCRRPGYTLAARTDRAACSRRSPRHLAWNGSVLLVH